MGVGLQPLEFTDCLTDSPYFREKLHSHEKELEKTSQQIKGLIKEVKELLRAAKNLSRAQRALSSSLMDFNFECIGANLTDDEMSISMSLKEFGRLIASIEDQRDMMLDRAYDQIILPLENFRKEHIGGVKEGKKKFEKQTGKFCLSQERYLNLSTKKQDTVLKEADAALVMEHRHFVQASLEYVFLLQEVQERKKFEFVETLLGFMYGWLTFYHQGHEVANEFKPYMRELQHKLQKTRENFNSTRDITESYMQKMLEKAMETGGSIKPDVKEGYLYLMEKKAFGTTWTKQYCTYHRDTKEFRMLPYNQMTGKFNSAESLTLASCVRRMSDSIEKRFCFDITSIEKPGVPAAQYTLQALSEEDRKQWMDIMDGKEPVSEDASSHVTYAVPGKISKPEERPLDDVGISFVKRCIEVLESRGLEEQGLYRVAGVSSKVTKLVSMGLDRRKTDRLPMLDDAYEWDSKTITSALKTYLRNLPEPLMTYRYHNGFIAAAKQETQSLRVNDVHTLVHRLPQQNKEVLEMLIKHLRNIVTKSDKNLMTVSNLGVCFGPTLLRPEEETVAAIMDIKFCNIVVEILIENYDKIFLNKPANAEVPQRELAPVQTGAAQNHAQTATAHVSHTAKINYVPGPQPVPHAVTRLYDGTGAGANRDHGDGNGVGYLHGHKGAPAGHWGAAGTEGGLPPAAAGYGAFLAHPKYRVPPAFLHDNHAGLPGSDRVFDQCSNSSSSESVSSLPSKESSNHNNYVISPQKNKRGLRYDAVGSAESFDFFSQERRYFWEYKTGVVGGIHSASVYRGHDASRVRTLYACMGENDGELSFEPNQIITNVRQSKEPGWLEGTLNGKTGLVPENYVEFLP
ncbi:rho GTPase-activating protein Graf isoform X2 [Bacillus rossius redtenbacheri]|uniref:rho GTPase-activating protein Graf isoform X2 n=1 Tax=Bacillus rossius redtenbacheri TaxID=93214 RepID=UPI002FDCF400